MKKHLLVIILLIIMGGDFSYSQSPKEIADSLFIEKKYNEAIVNYKISLDRASLNEDKFDILKKIIDCYMEKSDFSNCITYSKQALLFTKKAYGNGSSEYASVLWYLCHQHYLIDDYSESIEYGKRAIYVFDRCISLSSNEKWQFMECYKTVGIDNYFLNQYGEALYFFSNWSNKAIERYGSVSTENANALYYLGLSYSAMNNYACAIQYFQQSADIYMEKEGENSNMYNRCLSHIANAYSYSKKHIKAIDYALKSYNINKKYGNDSTYAWVASIRSVGHAYHFSGNEDEAIKYYNVALEQYKKIYGKFDDSDYIYIGRAYRYKGDWDKSLEYLQKADELHKSESDETNTFLAYNLSKMYFGRGEYQKAYYNIKADCDKLTERLYEEFTYMSSDSRACRWSAISEDYDALLEASVEVDSPESRAEAYNSLLLSKGILLSTEQQLRDVVANSNNERLLHTFMLFKDTKDKISKESEKGNQKAVDYLKSLADGYETEIMKHSNLFGDIAKNLKINYEDVKAHLGPKDVAIEFFFTEHGKFGALVMKRDFREPELVMLKDSSYGGVIENGALNRQSPYHGLGLYNNIWKPLEKYFNKDGNIYFSPSGKLHTLAIEYAPIDDSTLISNKYRIHRVSSTRYLALQRTHEAQHRAVIYGGINYDTDIDDMVEHSKYYIHSLSELYVSRQYIPYNGEPMPYLPATLEEAKLINTILNHKKYITKLMTGSEANEESVKKLSGLNCDILHIATHGYCENDFSLNGDNALELSGLLFSGSNNASMVSSDIEDGVLSAKEISLLDFRNVDMVVISACETGLGEISNEGVFGLQRGFKKAGVNTIVMSLWPVSDNATKIWMAKFYENFAQGMNKQQAFSKAQHELRKEYKHPAFWAAFIMLDGE